MDLNKEWENFCLPIMNNFTMYTKNSDEYVNKNKINDAINEKNKSVNKRKKNVHIILPGKKRRKNNNAIESEKKEKKNNLKELKTKQTEKKNEYEDEYVYL